MRLNLGAGKNHIFGFQSVDISGNVGADIVYDLTKYPWPWDDSSIDEIHCAHFIEHLDGIERMAFFNECYRVMKPGATMKCITPAPFTHQYMQDPTHKFPMVVPEFYNYLNAQVRKNSGLEHYPLTCDFTWKGYFTRLLNPCEGKTEDVLMMMERHYINTLCELHVALEKL